MIRPTATLAFVLAAAAAASLIMVIADPMFGFAAVWFLVAILLLTLADFALSKKPKTLDIVYSTEKRIQVGRPAYLDLFADFKGAGPHPGTLASVAIGGVFRPIEKAAFDLPRDGVRIPLAAKRRGIGTIDLIRVRWFGPLRLIYWQTDKEANLEIPVVPDTRPVEREALTFSERDALVGVKPQRQQGEGTEFEALREFVAGLDPRSIDWKHSARHNQLLCKQFEVERNHQVILAFDTGHLMCAETEGLAKIDHAINAGLVLAYRTLGAGDKVGLFAFDSLVRDYMAPTAGPQTLSMVRDHLTRLEYSPDETNFTLGLTTLLGRLNRRSLIILFTDFVDTITARIMMENVNRLARHHVVLFVTFRDALLYDLTEREPDVFDDVSQAVIARQFIEERNGLFTRLRQTGVQCLEAPAPALAGKLVSQYLYIKQRELI